MSHIPTGISVGASDEMFMKTKKLNFTHDHIPCSVALHSNVDPQNPTKLFAKADPQTLLDNFVDYLLDLSRLNDAVQSEKFQEQTEQLAEKISVCDGESSEAKNLKRID